MTPQLNSGQIPMPGLKLPEVKMEPMKWVKTVVSKIPKPEYPFMVPKPSFPKPLIPPVIMPKRSMPNEPQNPVENYNRPMMPEITPFFNKNSKPEFEVVNYFSDDHTMEDYFMPTPIM